MNTIKTLVILDEPRQMMDFPEEDTLILALNREVEEALLEKKIPYKVPNDFIKKSEFENIPEESIKLVRKVGEAEIDGRSVREYLTYGGMSFWDVIENNLADLLFQGSDTIQKIKIYKNVISAEKPKKIITPCDEEIIKAVLKSKGKKIEVESTSGLSKKGIDQKIFNHLYRCMIRMKFFERKLFSKGGLEKNNFKLDGKKIMFIPTTESEIPTLLPLYNELREKNNMMVIDIPSLRDRVKRSLTKNGVHPTPMEAYIPFTTKKNADNIADQMIKVWKKIRERKELEEIRYLDMNVFGIIRKFIDFYFYERERIREIVLNAEAMNEIMRVEKPDMVVISDDVSEIGKPISLTAKKYGIPVVAIQHGLFGRRSMIFGPTYVTKMAVWSEDIKKKLCKNGFEKNQLVVTGCPKFDSIKFRRNENDIFEKLNLNKKDKIAVFISQPTAQTWDMAPFVFKTMENFPQYKLIVKLHPREYSEKFYEELKRKTSVDARIIKDVNIFDLISSSEFVIAASSTAGLETIILDKPLILLNFSYEPDPVPYVEENVALGVYRYFDLEGKIKSLGNRETVLKLKKNRKKFLKKHLYKLDGKACERIVAVVSRILHEQTTRFTPHNVSDEVNAQSVKSRTSPLTPLNIFGR